MKGNQYNYGLDLFLLGRAQKFVEILNERLQWWLYTFLDPSSF